MILSLILIFLLDKNIAEVKAYCPCAKCCGKETFLTSIQKNARKSGLAANPKKFLYSTRIFIPTIGILTVDDTGGSLRKKYYSAFEIRFQSHEEALKWGKKIMPYLLLNEEDDRLDQKINQKLLPTIFH